ncbi:protein Daple [Aplochiton taeniatus]
MDVTVSELLNSFMESPLVLWVRTLGPLGSSSGCDDKLTMFLDLVDGVFLHKIMTHIDPSPANQRVNKNVNNDVNLRIQNLHILTKHIKQYYQENLQQLILMALPNVLTIAKDPLSATSMEEMKRLLLLVLGCAVQCERKEEMIEKIKLLDIETQSAIVSHIQEVTHNQQNVLDLSWAEAGSELPAEELDSLSRSLALTLRKLIDERDNGAEVIVDLTQERDYLVSQQPQITSSMSGNGGGSSGGLAGMLPGSLLSKEEKQHLSVELADTKAKLRRYRQELEEKTEQLMDTKHEAERLDLDLHKLKQENTQLLTEARSVRLYRDEVDSLRERAAKVDRLETELGRCKERLNDVHFYKTRVEELREDNLTLLETKVLLEEQLGASRGRCDKLHELEKDNLQLRSKLHDIEMERESDKRRLEELIEENLLLEINQKQSMNESAHLGWELEQLAKNHDNNTDTRKSFVVEMNESVSSRLLKLEKENQELQSTVQQLRESTLGLEEMQLHTLELERENQGLGKKLERLQGLLDQEKMTNQDMESLGEELLKDKQELEKEMASLRGDKDQQITELEQERQHLTQAVASLRERAQSDSEAHGREVEQENRVLHQTISETGARVARLESQCRQTKQEVESLGEKARRCEEAEREAGRLERSRDALQREVASLRISCERADALEKEVTCLEQEQRRLRREAEEAQRELTRQGRLKEEISLLSTENQELRSELESLRPATSRLTALEKEQKEERREAQKEREELARLLEEVKDEARGERKRADRLEQSWASLGQEIQRLEEERERSKELREELNERELKEAQSKEEQFRREIEELREERKKREQVEEERRMMDHELSVSEKDRKQLEKESRRIKTQLEAKEAELEEKDLRLARLEKESVAFSKEVDRLKEVSVRVKDLERDNKELQKQATIDKRTLATLREELVSEKLCVQQRSNELECVSQELEKMGLNRERLLQETHCWEDSKYRLLENRLEETVQQTLMIREEKIGCLESRLEQSSNLNGVLRTELVTLRKTVEALRQRQEEEQNHNSLQGEGQAQESTRGQEVTAELLRVKDHVVDVEKTNASLQTERQLLKEQIKQLETQSNVLNSQMGALQRHTNTLQEQNTSLHTQTAKLQVENSTLNSQTASLMAQNAVLQGQVAAMETEGESWQRQREEANAGREGVLRDHERLLSVHERQAAEYEQLISQHASLKARQRALEGEHRALHNQHVVLMQQKGELEEREGRGLKEREELKDEKQKNRLLQQENEGLREEADRLTDSQSQQSEQWTVLQQQTKETKASLNASQLEVNRWQALYDSLKEQHQGLDISMTKLDNHCELLSRLKGNLEEENHHLLSQVQMLSQQNQTLLERTMESKEHYHEEQKVYIDKLNALRRQKEKLEEKIMDQYKFYDPAPKKRSQWSGAKALVKLIKPRKESSSGRERERVRSALDIPLPSTPPSLLPPDGSPPLPPPPLPPRQSRLGSDTPDDGHGLINHSYSTSLGPQSPGLTPGQTSKGETHQHTSTHTRNRGREPYRTPGGSSESVNGDESHTHRNYTTSPTTLGLTPSARPGPGRRPRGIATEIQTRHLILSAVGLIPAGLVYDEDARINSPDAILGIGLHESTGYRPGSADLSRNTSSSNSPVNSRGSLERLQGRSTSLSSDDVVGLSQSQLSLSRSSTLPYDSLPQRSQPQRSARPAQTAGATRTRPSSPGSEMVTLEEFLYESNTLSPPTVQTGSREDLMTDYFTRGPSPPLREGAKTPTSYVTPTVQSANHRPGQSVKPSPRQPLNQSPLQGQTPPSRTNQSLSRTFSLASADLLRSNGPDSYRGNDGSPSKSEAVVRRPGGGASGKERPVSARLAGDPGYLALSPHHFSSLSLQTERSGGGGGSAHVSRNGPPSQPHHRGEVAMVTPVRAVPAMRLDEAQEGGDGLRESRLADPSPMKEGGCGSEERPKSTPASPDPNDDPQTVWYEYGCV